MRSTANSCGGEIVSVHAKHGRRTQVCNRAFSRQYCKNADEAQPAESGHYNPFVREESACTKNMTIDSIKYSNKNRLSALK